MVSVNLTLDMSLNVDVDSSMLWRRVILPILVTFRTSERKVV
jgi:hypothetical protein